MEQGSTLPGPGGPGRGVALAGSVAQPGQASRPRAARSDAEAFFPAIDVTEP